MDSWKIIFIIGIVLFQNYQLYVHTVYLIISLVAKMVQEQYLKNCPAPIFMYFIILKWSFSLHNHKVYR